jgi:ribosomal protein L29
MNKLKAILEHLEARLNYARIHNNQHAIDHWEKEIAQCKKIIEEKEKENGKRI